MNKQLLRSEVQQFIIDHTGADVQKLALSKNPFPDIPMPEVVAQIAARTKAKEKFPTWFAAKNVIYPTLLSLAQASSEIAAQYKSSLISGNSLIDLTGGFGVDTFFFARVFDSVVHCEAQPELSQIAAHNFEVFAQRNVTCLCGDGISTLQDLDRKYDWIYIDPSRRHESKGKVFMLHDCEPNVPNLLDVLFEHSDRILVKTSPMLDISAGLSELRHIRRIHIVAVDNEVKELLWHIDRHHSGQAEIKAVNIGRAGTTSFDFMPGNGDAAQFSSPMQYLYEPNAAIMKSGGYAELSSVFGMAKLHEHSHLYTSDILKYDFPGRIFNVENVLPYSKGAMKPLIGTKANITTRNFPDTVEVLRRKWKISDGGDSYYFFTTDIDNRKIVLLCTKL